MDGSVILGTNLANATAVDFGTAPVTTILTDTADEIVVESPAPNVLGPVNVTVTTAGGTSPISSSDTFVYAAPGAVAPRVSGISPPSGPVRGARW